MLSNREMMLVSHLAEAFNEFSEAVKSDAGKEIRDEIAALEKAHGGAKRLDEAERILDDARGQAQSIINAAGQQAQKVEADTREGLAKREAALDRRETEVNAAANTSAERAVALSAQEKQAADRSASLDAREKSLDGRESALSARESRLATAEATLSAREAAATERENKIRAALA